MFKGTMVRLPYGRNTRRFKNHYSKNTLAACHEGKTLSLKTRLQTEKLGDIIIVTDGQNNNIKER